MTATAEAEAEDTQPDLADTRRRRDGRRWFVVLVAAAVAAVPVLLRDGRHQWFSLDEWSFLVNRSVSRPSTLFQPHNGHWVTVPAIVYRLLFYIWGLNTYRPYQLGSVTVHLAVVLLMWVVMRRLGVRPWIATAGSAAFIFFGSGAGNILYGFQITLTGAVFCGLAQLLLADHDGPVDRRDFAGLTFGIVGLMCSGVGVAMVVAVGVATLLRRGWRAAALHTAPLGVAYVVWYVAFPSDIPRAYSVQLRTLRFVGEMGRAVFVDLGQYRVVGAALGGLAIVGFCGLVRRALRARTWRPLAVPMALAAGFVAFALTTAVARLGFGVAYAASDRYVYVATALLLPLIALGAEALARRQAALGVASLMVLAVGVPGNVNLLSELSPYARGSPDYVEAAAHSPFLEQLPAGMRLPMMTDFAPDLAPTAGWLRTATAAGRVPRPPHPTPQLILITDLRLAVRPAPTVPPRVCPTARRRQIQIARGDHIAFSGAIVVVAVDGSVRSTAVPYNAPSGGGLDVVAGPLQIVITGIAGRPPRLC